MKGVAKGVVEAALVSILIGVVAFGGNAVKTIYENRQARIEFERKARYDLCFNPPSEALRDCRPLYKFDLKTEPPSEYYFVGPQAPKGYIRGKVELP